MSLGVTTRNLRTSSQNRSSAGAMPAKNRPDRPLPRHQQAEFSSATRHGAISCGCQIQRSAESKESKTLSVFRSHSGFLNKEFEHRLARTNGALFANPQGNQMEPPLVIHAMSNSHWLSAVRGQRFASRSTVIRLQFRHRGWRPDFCCAYPLQPALTVRRLRPYGRPRPVVAWQRCHSQYMRWRKPCKVIAV